LKACGKTEIKVSLSLELYFIDFDYFIQKVVNFEVNFELRNVKIILPDTS